MKKRHDQLLVGLLAVQVVLSVVFLWPRRAASVPGKPLLPGLVAGDMVSVTIADGEGKSIALRQAGGNWLLASADDYPAKGDKVSQLLDLLAGLSTARLVTRTAGSHRQLKVAADDFVRRLDLEKADGTRYRLYLGSSPRYGNLHVRLEGQDATYLVTDLSVGDAEATGVPWVDSLYFTVPISDVTSVTVQNDNDTFTLMRDLQGQWLLTGLAPGRPLDSSKVDALLRQVTTLRMLEPLGKEQKPAYGMNRPSALVTVKAGGRTITFAVGAHDPDDSSYVLICSESPYYVRVSRGTVQAFVENTRESYLQPPPTPTPTALATPEATPGVSPAAPEATRPVPEAAPTHAP